MIIENNGYRTIIIWKIIGNNWEQWFSPCQLVQPSRFRTNSTSDVFTEFWYRPKAVQKKTPVISASSPWTWELRHKCPTKEASNKKQSLHFRHRGSEPSLTNIGNIYIHTHSTTKYNMATTGHHKLPPQKDVIFVLLFGSALRKKNSEEAGSTPFDPPFFFSEAY